MINKRKKQSKVILVISIFALFALIFILMKSGITSGPLSSLFAKLNLPRAAQSEIKNQETLLLAARLDSLEGENKALKDAAGIKSPEEIPAQIKLGGGYLFSDILLLDKGKGAGLNPGDIVFSTGKIYIGKISETGENWSKVLPIGSLGGKIALRAGKNKEITFEATGTGRGELFTELPKDTVIASGDIVWLGEDPGYPAGLVTDIRKSEGREMQEVKIASPLPFGSLANIVVIKNR